MIKSDLVIPSFHVLFSIENILKFWTLSTTGCWGLGGVVAGLWVVFLIKKKGTGVPECRGLEVAARSRWVRVSFSISPRTLSCHPLAGTR